MQSHMTWVRKYACTTDLNGGQCIADDEVLTHHTSEKGSYNNAPRPEVMEVELSMMRGKLTKAEACLRRNGGRPAHPADVERVGVRYTTAGELRDAGFAVIHTCGRRGRAMAMYHSSGHLAARSTSRILPGHHTYRRPSRRALLRRDESIEPRHPSADRAATVAPCADG